MIKMVDGYLYLKVWIAGINNMWNCFLEKKMKKAYLGLVLVICLSACSQFENYVSGQAEKTVSAIPTETPYPTPTSNPTYTPIPLPTATPTLEPLTSENFDLSELFVESDLPSDRSYDEDLAFSLSSEFEYLPEPDMVASQAVHSYDYFIGEVVVAVYNDPEKLQSAIDAKLDEMGGGGAGVFDGIVYNVETYQITGVGEEGYVISMYRDSRDDVFYLVDVFFKRCNVYVDAQLLESIDSQINVEYAKKLDKRIQESSACGSKD